MTDLKSKRWIVAKGLMLGGIALMSAVLLLLQIRSIRDAALLAILVWSSCRFYYFLFYVLEHYVDPTMRYAGLTDLLLGMQQRRRNTASRSCQSPIFPDRTSQTKQKLLVRAEPTGTMDLSAHFPAEPPTSVSAYPAAAALAADCRAQ